MDEIKLWCRSHREVITSIAQATPYCEVVRQLFRDGARVLGDSEHIFNGDFCITCHGVKNDARI